MTPMSLFLSAVAKRGDSVAIPPSGCHIIDKAALTTSPLALKKVLRGILGKWKLTDRVLVNWLSPN
ncbi:hypothetical protein ACK3ZG_17335, partial [Aeromonas caviae]